jgi:hypothetical protein
MSIDCRGRWSQRAELERRRRMERLRAGMTSVQQACEEWPCGDRLVPGGKAEAAKSLADFAATGFFQCRSCHYVWQEGKENDIQRYQGEEIRICPRCAKNVIKWCEPVR